MKNETVNHPSHYGGAENPYEAIKVIEAWGLDFHLGNTIKYISRAGKKTIDKELEDLQKAEWYLKRKIEQVKEKVTVITAKPVTTGLDKDQVEILKNELQKINLTYL